MSDQTKAHQELQARILTEFGGHPELSLFTNPCGRGFYGRILPQLDDLAARGPQALHASWRGVLMRNWVTYGLGEGSPDLPGHYGPQALYVELKTGAGKLSPAQRRWHRAARRKGAAVVVVSSPEDLHRHLEELRHD